LARPTLVYDDGQHVAIGDAVLFLGRLNPGRVARFLGDAAQTNIVGIEEAGPRTRAVPAPLLASQVFLIARDQADLAAARRVALQWLEQAAGRGMRDAGYALARELRDGDSPTPAELERAAGWLRREAEQGHSIAMFDLALACYHGRGVPPDGQAARRWFAQAARHGEIAAQYDYWMTFEDDVRLLTEPWNGWERVNRMAEGGDRVAQLVLGLHYGRDTGTGNDPQQAIAWYSRAVAQGHGVAMCNLAHIHEHGIGVPTDPARAFELYMQAAPRVVAAQYSLGEMYRQGRGVAPDAGQARRWLSLAARQGWKDAEASLAAMDAAGAAHQPAARAGRDRKPWWRFW
jgi:TPR repeat protein